MLKRTVSGIMLTLLLIGMLTLAFNTQPVKAELTTWTVDDDELADFHTIQEAINAADSGDTILVHSGIYYENVVVNKTVLLIGENRSTTIIDGAGNGTVVSVTANNVTISEFTIENGGSDGILLDHSDGNTISENIITNNYYYGIGIWYSGYNTLRNNVLTRNWYNFLVYGTSISDFVQDIDVSNKVDGKTIYYWVNQHNRQVPVDAGYVSVVNSTDITVKNLNLTNNGDGVQLAYTTCSTVENVTASDNFVGVHLIYSSNNLLIQNDIVSNDGIGIRLYHSTDNTVLANTIKNNANGIISWYSGSNKFSDNTISNRWVGIGLRYSDNNTVFHNSFINNTEQASLKESFCNTWDDGYPSGGNYWSDHVTVDDYSGINQDMLGSDGIVDEPYVIDDDNRDNYPLVKPWSPVISATIDIDPDTLNLMSKGQWITAYMQLPEGYNAEDIDATTILLNGTIHPVLDPKYDFVTNSSEYIVDHDSDDILERMVKFNRTEVALWIYNDLGIDYGNIALTITGELFDGTPFEGTDTVKVLYPGDVDDDGDVDSNDFYLFSGCYGMSIENSSYNPLADFNEDGCINSEDFYILSGNYGKTAL